MRKRKRGLFIVLDGIDGSGKTTQVNLLIKRLRDERRQIEKVDFPQYGKKSAAMVEEYLNGEFGTAEEVGPYRASVFYACDRYAASSKIRRFLNEGRIVISDRYVTANMGHQGGKIKSAAERKKYFRWLHALEFDIFKIPRPDLNLILHVSAATAQKLAESSGQHIYIKKGKKDIHESNLKHLQDAEKAFLEIARTFPKIQLVECMRGGKIMGKKEISDLIWNKLKKRLS